MKISIPIELETSQLNGTIYAWATNPDWKEAITANGAGAGSKVKLKRRLHQAARQALSLADETMRHWQRLYIGCADGTVLHVEYRYGSWGYSIVGPARKHHGKNATNDTFEATCERARSHAAQCYGGVAWETH